MPDHHFDADNKIINKILQLWSISAYIKLLEIQCWIRIQNSNDNLACLKLVIDMRLRGILSDAVIFESPRMKEQFFTLLKVKIFEIPYFEFKYCYKLLNKEDICKLFNITKQLKLMEIE